MKSTAYVLTMTISAWKVQSNTISNELLQFNGTLLKLCHFQINFLHYIYNLRHHRKKKNYSRVWRDLQFVFQVPHRSGACNSSDREKQKSFAIQIFFKLMHSHIEMHISYLLWVYLRILSILFHLWWKLCFHSVRCSWQNLPWITGCNALKSFRCNLVHSAIVFQKELRVY